MPYHSRKSGGNTPRIRQGNVRQNIRARSGQYRYEDGSPYTGTRVHMHDGRYMEGAYHSNVPHKYLYKNNGGNQNIRYQPLSDDGIAGLTPILGSGPGGDMGIRPPIDRKRRHRRRRKIRKGRRDWK
tara:strand:- start:704 stop:1084 length:381 start_codon:yes stop_codon:yes gene_type:complete